MDKVAQLTAQLQEAQLTASHASELLEQDQVDKRELQEQFQDIAVSRLGYHADLYADHLLLLLLLYRAVNRNC